MKINNMLARTKQSFLFRSFTPPVELLSHESTHLGPNLITTYKLYTIL